MGQAQQNQRSYERSAAQKLFSAFVESMVQYNGPRQHLLPGLLNQAYIQIKTNCVKHQRCSARDANQHLQQLISQLQDDHTYLDAPWTPSVAETAREELEQELGISVLDRPEGWYVAFVMFGGSGDLSGLQVGDLILRAAGRDIVGAPRSWKVNFRKERSILVERQGKRLRIEVDLDYQDDYWQKALYRLQGDTAILQIPTFQHDDAPAGELTISESLHRALQELQEKQIRRLVLDLRYNNGGWMDECAASASAFVSDIWVYQDEKYLARKVHAHAGQVSQVVGLKLPAKLLLRPKPSASKTVAFWEPQVVVLVNKQTASCGEWFTYQLQRAGKALVVGEATYGILNTSTLETSLGYGYHLQITVIRSLHEDFSPYPSHITPDVRVQNSPTEDLQLQKALELLGPL